VLAKALLNSAEISKAEGKKSNLRTIICGRNRLENGSASAWAEAFAAHGGLEEVRMPQNGIRMDGITALARGLSKNANLRHVDFQDNTFTEDGATKGLEAWTEALQSWAELHTLNLSDCVLSSDGEVPILLSALAEGSNSKLHTLQLQNNNLESQTFSLLADNITSGLSSLMRLEIQDNDQEEDDEHLETIALSLKQRGGKLFATDDDEDEEEEEKEEFLVPEAPTSKIDLDKVELREEDKKAVEKAADDLAELMSKVGIN
jgi:Ran GTPase-activating protein 1